MTISAKWSVVGGIVGRLYAAGHITDCANYGPQAGFVEVLTETILPVL